VILALASSVAVAGIVWFRFVRTEWVPTTVWLDEEPNPTASEIVVSIAFGCGPMTRVDFTQGPQVVEVRGYEEGRGRQWCSVLNIAEQTLVLDDPIGHRALVDESGRLLFDNRCIASDLGCSDLPQPDE
jgi:hypothetical protein